MGIQRKASSTLPHHYLFGQGRTGERGQEGMVKVQVTSGKVKLTEVFPNLVPDLKGYIAPSKTCGGWGLRWGEGLEIWFDRAFAGSWHGAIHLSKSALHSPAPSFLGWDATMEDSGGGGEWREAPPTPNCTTYERTAGGQQGLLQVAGVCQPPPNPPSKERKVQPTLHLSIPPSSLHSSPTPDLMPALQTSSEKAELGGSL